MKKVKQLGIWMDHSRAFLMELTNNTIIENIVESEFTQQEKENSLSKNEKFMYKKKQQFQSGYYKKLSDIMINYHEIILFGPTDAKNELLNLLRANFLFEKIRIEVKDTDKMTARQMHAYVKEYFK